METQQLFFCRTKPRGYVSTYQPIWGHAGKCLQRNKEAELKRRKLLEGEDLPDLPEEEEK